MTQADVYKFLSNNKEWFYYKEIAMWLYMNPYVCRNNLERLRLKNLVERKIIIDRETGKKNYKYKFK